MHVSFLFFSCFWAQPFIHDEEHALQNPNTSKNETAKILFNAQGKSAYSKLWLPDHNEYISRIRTGSLRDKKAQRSLEITSKCTTPVANDTERICLTETIDLSIFAPRIADAHAARSLFQIRGYKHVWIHDVQLRSLPSQQWNILHSSCTYDTLEKCEEEYKVRIQSQLSMSGHHIPTLTEEIFLKKQGLYSQGKIDCDGNGSFETESKDSSLSAFLNQCPLPYTGMWTYWAKNMPQSKQLRRLGSFFYLYDNDEVIIEHIHLTGITGKGMIRASNNGSITIRHSSFSGIQASALSSLGYDLGKTKMLMGTGISILEGEHSSSLFDCSIPSSAKHRHTCLGRNYAQGTCKQHKDCTTDARCVRGLCKSNQCDTQKIDIHHNHMSGCEQYNWEEKVNDDGIQLSSVSATVHHNTIQNFTGCDSLIDVGHRGGCDFREGEAAQKIKIYDNKLSDGKIKTTGAAAGEHEVIYTHNEMKDIRISDYHQNWISRYLNNQWYVSSESTQDYLWGERSAVGTQPWQAPYYGKVEIKNNHIHSLKKNLIILFTKRFDPQKFNITNNTFQGESFVWLKSQGERRRLYSSRPYTLQFFDTHWIRNKGWISQPSQTLYQWNDFVKIAPQNRWVDISSSSVIPEER